MEMLTFASAVRGYHVKPSIGEKLVAKLIFIYRRFSVQFVTTISQFILSERNGLVYKPHPQFLPQNFICKNEGRNL